MEELGICVMLFDVQRVFWDCNIKENSMKEKNGHHILSAQEQTLKETNKFGDYWLGMGQHWEKHTVSVHPSVIPVGLYLRVVRSLRAVLGEHRLVLRLSVSQTV